MNVDAIYWSSFDWKDNRFDKSYPPIPVSLKNIPQIFNSNGNVFDGDTVEEVFNSDAGDLWLLVGPFSLILIGFISLLPDSL